ncbi:hypothetical protein FRC12_006119 [Ceratobasidium sp. 428]|nr:hypothetical protein FRC12_006119 [Ceratobasidium sp. 428]
MSKLCSFTRVFNIPELGDYICDLFYINESEERRSSHSDEDEETDIAALMSLLCTCKATFRPAARRIWGTPVQVERLLTILPGISVVKVNPSLRLSYWVIQEAKVPEYTAPTFLTRFKLYAPYIKSLRVENVFWPDDWTDYGETVCSVAKRLLEKSAEEGTLLPNLKSLAITANEGCPYNPERLDWATVLLSSSISSLKLIGIDMGIEKTRLKRSRMEFTTAALRKCVNIEKLELEFFHDDQGSLSGLLPGFFDSGMPKLSRLRRLVCRQSTLCPELLQWLQSIPNIESLVLDGLNPESDLPIIPPISPDAFSSLKFLGLYVNRLEPAIRLFQTPLVHHLSILAVDYCPGISFDDTQLLQDFVTQVKKSCPGLTRRRWPPLYNEPADWVI